MTAAARKPKAHLFATCVVDQFFPEVAESVVLTLRALDVEVEFDPAQTCCGQPAFNTGYWNEAMPLARRFLELYDGSDPVVVPSGSCAAMIRNYYPELFAHDPVNRRRAELLAASVYEFTEYLDAQFGPDRVRSLMSDHAEEGRPRAAVAFHESCHAKRELGVDAQPKALLDALPRASRVDLPQAEVCCGFGGTFSVKYPDISAAMLRDKLDNILASEADVVAACDSSCLMHIGGGLKRRGSRVRPAHVAELIAESLNAPEGD